MAEWLYEAGIGEARAALVEAGIILEAAIEPDDAGPRAGAVLPATLTRGPDATGRAQATLADGTIVQLAPAPPGLSAGRSLLVEIVRTALPERGRTKPPRARPADPAARPGDGPDLLARIRATGIPVRTPGPGDDPLEALGWSEVLEEAASGVVARADCLLEIALTPAMTVIDVDGTLPAPVLAVAGAGHAGAAIRRLGIAGSIGIDLPTLAGKAERQAAAQALDAALPGPFERTAVNGFGFLQLVRRRARPSLMETLAADPAGAAARALLRRAERTAGGGALTLTAAPAVIARLEARPDWLEALARRAGFIPALRARAGMAISAGHADRACP